MNSILVALALCFGTENIGVREGMDYPSSLIFLPLNQSVLIREKHFMSDGHPGRMV